jgi:tetratricopeptide (TPR) repeat protein
MIWDFLFGSIFGWWILFLIGMSLIAVLRSGYRKWLRHRRAMAANLARLSDPGNAESRFALAQVYAEGRRWKSALTLVDEAIAIARVDSRYNHVPHRFLRLKADALYGTSEWIPARDAYHEALNVPSDTGYADALLGVARSELRAGHWKEAVEFSRHAIGEHESRLEAYFRWAQAASAGGDGAETARARAEFRRVAAMLPPFARQRRMWWRFAFLTFPIARRIG